MVCRRFKAFAILVLLVSSVFAEAAVPVQLKSGSEDKEQVKFHKEDSIVTVAQAGRLKSCAQCFKDSRPGQKRNVLRIDTEVASRYAMRKKSLDTDQEGQHSRQDDSKRKSLHKRGGGKGMDRHLAAASFAALLAVGTASMGVATYALRLNDWKKYKKPAFKKGAKALKSEKKLEEMSKSKTGNATPGSPQSPSSPDNVYFVNNTYNQPTIYLTQKQSDDDQLLLRNATRNGTDSSRPPARSERSNTTSKARPNMSKRAIPASMIRATHSKAFMRQPLRASARRHPKTRLALQPDGKAAKVTHPTPTSTVKATQEGEDANMVSRGKPLLDFHKFDKWAPLAAKIEDYGKVSAASGAFLAGALSLFTSASEHHEYRKLDKDGNGIKDEDEDKNGNGVRDGDEDENKEDGEKKNDAKESEKDKRAKEYDSVPEAFAANDSDPTQRITITIHDSSAT